MDRLESMTVFVEIVTAGSLVAAAERLNLSPSMVGKHLNALEERLGVKLQPFGLVKTDMMTGRLNRLLAGYATRGRDFYLLYARDPDAPAKLRVFVEFALDHFAAANLGQAA